MQVTQIPQRRLILVTHPLRKPRIIQPLIPRRLRHVLQHPQPIANRLLPVRRHLAPLRQHIVPHVIALLRRHPIPHLRAIPQHLLLRWRHALQPLFVLQSPLPVRRRHIPPAILSIRRLIRRPIRIRLSISARPRDSLRAAGTGIRRPIRMRVLPRSLRACFRPLPMTLRRIHLRRHRQHQHRRQSQSKPKPGHKPPAKAQPAPPLTEFAHLTHRKNSRLPAYRQRYISVFESGCC
jgi:hypothetical protein